MHQVTQLSDCKFKACFSFFLNLSSYAYVSSTVAFKVYNQNIKEIKDSVFCLLLWEVPFGKSDNSA